MAAPSRAARHERRPAIPDPPPKLEGAHGAESAERRATRGRARMTHQPATTIHPTIDNIKAGAKTRPHSDRQQSRRACRQRRGSSAGQTVRRRWQRRSQIPRRTTATRLCWRRPQEGRHDRGRTMSRTPHEDRGGAAAIGASSRELRSAAPIRAGRGSSDHRPASRRSPMAITHSCRITYTATR
jgi:hypothetical protein